MEQELKNSELNTPLHGEQAKDCRQILELCSDDICEGLPEWLKEAFDTLDDAPAPAFIIPYMNEEFLNWLVDHRQHDRKYAKTILSAYETAYERLNYELQIDLYAGLEALYPESLDTGHNSEAVNEFAVDLVAAYVEMMEEKLKDNPKSFSPAEQRAILAYYDFISWVGGLPEIYVKKTWRLPFADEFRDWLTPKHNDTIKAYENAVKTISSVKCFGMCLDPVSEYWETWMYELADARDKDSRKELEKKIMKSVSDAIEAFPSKSRKTISNGLTNLAKYFIFLDYKYKTVKNETK